MQSSPSSALLPSLVTVVLLLKKVIVSYGFFYSYGFSLVLIQP